MENIDAIDRLEKHNRTYVPGASEENNNGKFLGPDEIDLLVDAHRIEREEKEQVPQRPPRSPSLEPPEGSSGRPPGSCT